MSFILSKLLWPFAAPGNFLVMAAVLGLALQVLGGPRWSRYGLGLSAAVVAVLVALTVLPVAAWSLLPRPIPTLRPAPVTWPFSSSLRRLKTT